MRYPFGGAHPADHLKAADDTMPAKVATVSAADELNHADCRDAAADALGSGSLDDLVILGDFERVSKSPLWRLSEMYWALSGSDAFTAGEVPYGVTNDGPHAGDAADLFVESALAAEQAGQLEDELFVLELGVGSGLFAKLFLDQLKDRCQRDGLDLYQRTRYIATDGSASMLDDLDQTGVLVDHADRVERFQLRLPDLKAGLDTAGDLGRALPGAVRAIHANYLLDSLPFTLLCLDQDRLWELQVRGRIAAADLEHLGLGPDDQSLDMDEIGCDPDQLEAIQESLILETRYVPIERSAIPMAGALPNVDPAAGPIQFLHGFAALECLDGLTPLLRPDGYVVVTDYGYTGEGEPPEVFEPQNFGRSVACSVNFEQIARHVANMPGLDIHAPESDPDNLQSRLIGRELPTTVRTMFRERYSGENWDLRNRLLTEGKQLADEGRFEAARWKYEQLLRQQPYSWSAHELAAAYLVYTLEENDAAIVVARQGLQLNHLSSGLWNVLGDCHFAKKEYDVAEDCYEHALCVNPRDARGRMNLAYVAVLRSQFAKALRLIGEALALDREGEFHETLLAKQIEAMNGLVQSAARGVLRGANRMRGHYKLPHASLATPDMQPAVRQAATNSNHRS